MITKTQWHTLKQKDNFKPSFAHNTDTDYAKTHQFFFLQSIQITPMISRTYLTASIYHSYDVTACLQ